MLAFLTGFLSHVLCLWWLVLLLFQKQRLFPLPATYTIIAKVFFNIRSSVDGNSGKRCRKKYSSRITSTWDYGKKEALFSNSLIRWMQLNFFSYGPDRPNFYQIKIIILISHINTFLWLFIFLLVWALSFNSKKSNKKSKFLILNWKTKHSISYFTSMINIF